MRRAAPLTLYLSMLVLSALALHGCTFQVSVEEQALASNTASPPPLEQLVARSVAATLTAMPTPASIPIPSMTPPESAAVTLIDVFELGPREAAPGDTITLTWSFNGELGLICELNAADEPEQCWNVDNGGNMTVQISPTARNLVIYSLTVYRDTESQQLRREVVLSCPDEWFFLEGPVNCPSAPALQVAAISQPFERGLMIGLLGRIFILFGTASAGSGPYVEVADNFNPNSTPDPLTPPPGLYEPVRGFGVLWRGTVNPSGEITPGSIRDRLGWATEQVSGYVTSYQCDSTAIEEFRTCYLQGPGGVVYALGLGVWRSDGVARQGP